MFPFILRSSHWPFRDYASNKLERENHFPYFTLQRALFCLFLECWQEGHGTRSVQLKGTAQRPAAGLLFNVIRIPVRLLFYVANFFTHFIQDAHPHKQPLGLATLNSSSQISWLGQILDPFHLHCLLWPLIKQFKNAIHWCRFTVGFERCWANFWVCNGLTAW